MRRGFPVLLAAVAGALPARAEEEAAHAAVPPPINVHYLQYGVAVGAEMAASSGDVCPVAASTPCILGSGGGLAVRVGYRARSPWYVGGAYEFSRQDSANLLRLPILQQLRAETRFHFHHGTRLTPYAATGLGAVLYGSEWTADTGGVTAFLGAGLEFQVTQSTVIGPAFAYRPMLLRGWTDSAGQRRADRFLGFGVAHFVALELVLEIREPLARW